MGPLLCTSPNTTFLPIPPILFRLSSTIAVSGSYYYADVVFVPTCI